MSNFRLNAEQLKAVTHPEGPLLIIAGAGTGKTTVITERIKWLIEQGKAKPSEILALTFTEKAAAEMEERVDVALPIGYIQTWISTFHSFCEKVLRAEALHLGLDPAFRILSEAESYLFVKNRLFEFDLKYYRPLGNPTKFISDLITHFSRLRDEVVAPEEYLEFGAEKSGIGNRGLETDDEEWEMSNELAGAYKKYQELKIKEGVMDFADLIFYTLDLFKKRPPILARYRERFKYILIDEFQDTNFAQNELAGFLAGPSGNITVVCDDDQSIYRWRGAAVYNVLNFKKNFPGAQIVTLVKNYRSPQVLIDYAYNFIQHNNPNRLEVQEKIDKRLVSVGRRKGEKPRIIWKERVEDEAEEVAGEIKRLVEENPGISFRDCALLVRANNHALPFIQALSRLGIPYQFLGPGQLYHQPEIKDLIAYFRVLDDIGDDIALYRVLSMEWLKFDARDLALIRSYARRQNLSLFRALEKSSEIEGLGGKAQARCRKLIQMINRHLKLMAKEGPGQILYFFLKDAGLLKFYREAKSARHQRQINNISKFFDKIRAFEAQNPESLVGDFVEYLNFVISQGESPLASEIDWVDNEAVNILTFHSAKGLEFKVVFMVNLVNDRFPTRNRVDRIPLPEQLIREPIPSGDAHLQEERRLFYVGMTRSKELLYFTGAKFYGGNKRPKKLSPFVFEVMGEDIEPFLLRRDARQINLFGWRGKEEEKPMASEDGPANRSLPDFLSYSQLDTFNICPLEYKYKYVLRLPAPPSAAISFGTVMHRVLAEFYRRHAGLEVLEKKGRVAEDSRELGFEILKDLLDAYWISQGYKSRAQEEYQKAAAVKILGDFFEKFYSPDQVVKRIEFPFTIKVRGVKIRGVIDRVDELADGRIEIIDYKTGAVKRKKDVDKDLQLSLYALAAASPTILGVPLEKIKLSFIFLSEGKKISTARTEDDLRITQENIKKTLQQIHLGEFLPNPGRMCNFCPYQILCPAYRGRFKV
ncbi:hypothetical protein B5M47_01910 [candidate division CPR3 bacterium 4484_211]|uniref:DNA 3'-5' helicase n=1 Tax=candidate division CPR3 bacterium 4484_211 TaxID=1968527 RepID=A0A1W9NY88_UNCC3|nr:MAG: hypothetical protein B5M47_01910 [candidate division CPR3 bacterium 4484_211]